MNIISHRGLWKKPAERNTRIAFNRSLAAGFGIEIDLRDRAGELVISHDPADRKSMPFKQFLDLYKEYENPVILAINMKSDGLEGMLDKLLSRYGIDRYFIFDISAPSAYLISRQYRNMVFATRHSDLERRPVLYNKAAWVWLDELGGAWITNNVIEKHVRRGKRVCIASPELHRRAHHKAWAKYKTLSRRTLHNIWLCTDFPAQAERFFNGDKA